MTDSTKAGDLHGAKADCKPASEGSTPSPASTRPPTIAAMLVELGYDSASAPGFGNKHRWTELEIIDEIGWVKANLWKLSKKRYGWSRDPLFNHAIFKSKYEMPPLSKVLQELGERLRTAAIEPDIRALITYLWNYTLLDDNTSKDRIIALSRENSRLRRENDKLAAALKKANIND